MKHGDKEKIFKALGDSNRVAIMDMLKGKEMSAGQILNKIKMGQSTLSHHMKILCDCGIVNARKESRWVYYSVNREVADKIAEVLRMWAE